MSRIVWHSNAPWCGSGYGSQTKLFVPRVAKLGHEVAISAFYGLNGGVFTWEGHRVYPGDSQHGNSLLPRIAEAENADLVITLLDVWIFEPKKLENLRLACWVPVDHEPLPPRVLRWFKDSGSTPVAMSRFGERMLRDKGLDPLYVPHGVDTTAFRPRPKSRGRAQIGVPEDCFLIGMVAANKGNSPSRKAFPQVLEAFAQVREDIPNAYLYLHSDPVGEHGVNLGALAYELGIPPEFVIGPQPLRLAVGVPDGEMADLYAAFDCLASPSYGEGFGVPIIEAQACGTPVIVTDWSAMTELCGAGWLVGGDRWWDPIQRSFYKCPSVREIADAMRQAYERRDDVSLRNQARTFALEYDADRIARRYWRPALQELFSPVEALVAA